MRPNDPLAVRVEYADESRFLVRRSVWEFSSGPDALELVVSALAKISPRRVLEVGCGLGALPARLGPFEGPLVARRRVSVFVADR